MKVSLHLYKILVPAIILILTGCKNSNSGDNKDHSVSGLVTIPVGPDELIDTSSAAIFRFEAAEIDWDTIRMGDKFNAVFRFTNTGKRPGIISDVVTSCGCTAVMYSNAPIQPGESGEINVTFDSTGKLGYQKKSINVIGNTFPSRTLLYLQGFIEK